VSTAREQATDILIIGGGTAGFGAAIAAARRGAKVSLLEGTSKIGGVMAFCPGMPWGGGYPVGSTIGGIVMNMIVATMVTGPSTKPAGFLDQAVKTVFGGLLEQVQGHGYGQWFLIMAFLHPAAWLLLWIGRIHKPSSLITAPTLP
jgi:hypothetical protein